MAQKVHDIYACLLIHHMWHYQTYLSSLPDELHGIIIQHQRGQQRGHAELDHGLARALGVQELQHALQAAALNQRAAGVAITLDKAGQDLGRCLTTELR